MNGNGLDVDLYGLIPPLARTIDLMAPEVARHHMQVSCLAYRLAEAAAFPPDEQRTIAVAGALHDIGAFSSRERIDLLDFELKAPHQHAVAGAVLLEEFEPLHEAARIVRFHHVPWENGAGLTFRGQPVPMGSHVLHLADRMAVLIDPTAPILSQVPGIVAAAAEHEGDRFAPELIEAAGRLAERDAAWLEAGSSHGEAVFRRFFQHARAPLDMEGMLAFSELLCRVIDFKSAFTATHSSGVAAVASALAAVLGFSEEDQAMMQIAARLHDLGKLAIPSEILEKPGPLTPEERAIMRTHVYYTYEILQAVPELGAIASWSALHQERLSGDGYPFGYAADRLPLGARTIAVADVFTALAEDRPYRPGMKKEEAMAVLERLAHDGELDKDVVAALIARYDEMDRARAEAQRDAARAYHIFRKTIEVQSAA